MKDIGHDETMASALQEDPEYAKAYVQKSLRNAEQDEIEVVIRQLDEPYELGLHEHLCCSRDSD